jgi:hypothetical protein
LEYKCKSEPNAAETISALNNVNTISIVSHRNGTIKNDTIYFTKSTNEIKEFIGLFDSFAHNPESDNFSAKSNQIDGNIFITYDGEKTLKISYDFNCCYWFEYSNNTIKGLFTKRLSEFLGTHSMHKDKKNYLQGVWAENPNDNALFQIVNDSIYYTEHMDTPVSYKINGDTLIILYDGLTTKNLILKLDADNLVFRTEDNSINRLYKRK